MYSSVALISGSHVYTTHHLACADVCLYKRITGPKELGQDFGWLNLGTVQPDFPPIYLLKISILYMSIEYKI